MFVVVIVGGRDGVEVGGGVGAAALLTPPLAAAGAFGAAFITM